MIRMAKNIWILLQVLQLMHLGIIIEEYKEALKDQIDKLMHISNLYYTDTNGGCGRETGEGQRS